MSPLGSLGGIQFSSIPSLHTLLIVMFLGGDGAVHNTLYQIMYTLTDCNVCIQFSVKFPSTHFPPLY